MGLAEFRKVPVDSLRPHPLNEKLYPVNEEEDDDLAESMERSGMLEPIVALPDGTIISGTRRWRAARKLGWKTVRCEFRSFDDPELAILEYNRYRKKTPRTIFLEYRLIREKLAPLAQERQEATQLAGKEESGKPVTKAEKIGVVPRNKTEEIHVREKAAEEIGVSETTLHRISYVYEREHLPMVKPIVQQLDRGEISVRQAYEKAKRIVEPEPSPPPERELTWKCDGCGREYGEMDPVGPTRFTLCPDCVVDFDTWKAEKLYDES
jgi:hypothetical protein